MGSLWLKLIVGTFLLCMILYDFCMHSLALSSKLRSYSFEYAGVQLVVQTENLGTACLICVLFTV